MALLPGFVGLGGTSKRVKNLATGQEMSRTFYTTHFKRGNISPTVLAKINREVDAAASISRPARGRTSIQKLGKETKASIVKARLEHDAQVKAATKAAKIQKKADDKIERWNKKQKVKVHKFSKSLLKPGTKARRLNFHTYSDLSSLLQGAKDSGVVFNYMIGVVGISTRDPLNPQLVGPCYIPGRHINMPMTESDFNERTKTFLEEMSSYFHALHFYVQFAFTEAYYEKRAKDAGFKKRPLGGWSKPEKAAKPKKGKK